MTKNKAFTDLGDKVVFFGNFGETVVSNSFEFEVTLKDYADKFKEDFSVREGQIFGKKNEQYFDKVTFIRLIERLSDGKLFGYTYSEEIHPNGDIFLEPNGLEYGFDETLNGELIPAFVFLPVQPFAMVGYEVTVD